METNSLLFSRGSSQIRDLSWWKQNYLSECDVFQLDIVPHGHRYLYTHEASSDWSDNSCVCGFRQNSNDIFCAESCARLTRTSAANR